VNRYEEVYGVNLRKIEAFFRMALRTYPDWTLRGLVVIHDLQRPDEQRSMLSSGHDGKGMDRYGSPLLSSMAEKAKAGKRLTKKEMAAAREEVPKYWRQFFRRASAPQLRSILMNYYRVEDPAVPALSARK
jgi:hypothetical protein